MVFWFYRVTSVIIRILIPPQLALLRRISTMVCSGGAEIGQLSLRLSISQGASLGDFLLAPACPIEKVTLMGFLYLTSGSGTDEGVTKDKVFTRTGNRTQDSG